MRFLSRFIAEKLELFLHVWKFCGEARNSRGLAAKSERRRRE